MSAATAAVHQRKPASSTSLVGRILQGLEALETIDTHEHIPPESERVAAHVDFFTLASHYLMNDVISAGLPRASRVLIEKAETPEPEKWRLFEPYWKFARFTGYGEALRIAMRDIYGIAEISGSLLFPG